MNNLLYITGAGVSAESGIPTFRGNDGLWTVGSINYTPQEMATRNMYENNPGEFLLWYFKRFIALENIKPNKTHYWLSNKRLITQNIDGLDRKAGNKNYIAIHGSIDKLVIFDDQEIIQKPIDANWDEIDKEYLHDDLKLKKALLEKFKIPIKNSKYSPEKGVSFKPLVLLFDEIYTENFRFNESLYWMENCSKIIFMGTSFSVNITNIALEIAIEKNLPIEIVDPNPIKIQYSNIVYHKMNAAEYCNNSIS